MAQEKTPAKKLPKIQFVCVQEDLELVDWAAKHFPGIPESQLLRAAIRHALPAIVADRALASLPPLHLINLPPAPPPPGHPTKKR